LQLSLRVVHGSGRLRGRVEVGSGGRGFRTLRFHHFVSQHLTNPFQEQFFYGKALICVVWYIFRRNTIVLKRLGY